MSGVLLRCPNCGTTKAVPGECEACHESQVRYFCTNHTPGRWLDASACPQCGARFGEAAPPPRPARPARPAAAPAPTPPVRTPTPAPGPASPPRRAEPPAPRPAAEGDSWGRRRRAPSPRDEGAARGERPARGAPLPDRAPEPLREPVWTGPAPGETMDAPTYRRPRRGPGGCLVRLVLLAALLLFAILSVFLGLGGMLLQLFGVYY